MEHDSVSPSACEVDPIQIVAIDAWTCRYKLPKPLVFDDFVVAEREYLVVRLTEGDGTTGAAYALTRGAPLLRTLEALVVPLVLGIGEFSVSRLQTTFHQAMRLFGSDGMPLRAYSLVEVCLWDICAKRHRRPLWQVLGGSPRRLPALLVDLFSGREESVESLLEHLSARIDQGYCAFKLSFGGDVVRMTTLLSAARERLGWNIEFVVDAAMSFQRSSDVLDAFREWAPFQPLWIEDPFRGDETELLTEIQAAGIARLGAGDEVASTSSMRRLVRQRAVDVVRLDATCQGGVAGFSELARAANQEGLQVSAHTYPEVHRHLALAHPGMSHIEVFAPASRFDCAERFVLESSGSRPSQGVLDAPLIAGVGIDIDWDAVDAASTDRCAHRVNADH